MTLQITDNTTGKTYRVPEETTLFLREATEGSRYRPPINNGIKTALEFFEGGWSIKYNYSINYSDKFPLDPTRFQVSFEGMVSEERVKKMIGADRKATLKSIASALNIPLTEQAKEEKR